MVFKLLNLSKAEEMYNYVVRRRSEAKITDLYGALISLAIISLYKYRIFFDTIHITEARTLIQDAIKISETTDHVRGFLRASMVDQMLKMSVGEQDSIDEMEKVIELAQEKGLQTEARRAQKEIVRFKRMIKQQHYSENISVEKVLVYAREAKKIVWKNQ